jgi:hypothetical protein
MTAETAEIVITRGELDEILALTKPLLPARRCQLLEGVLGTFEFLMLKLRRETSMRRLQRLLLVRARSGSAT